MQVGQLVDTVRQMQSASSKTITSQTIPNLKGGGVGMAWLRSVSAKRYEIDEDLLKLFKKVEIKIFLIDAIKQILKYAKFLKELYIHRRKKMNGTVGTGGVMSSLCPNLGTFTVPCTISSRTFTNAMLDLATSINVMPASIYKLLNLGDLEPTQMEI
ncbi:hypothetical protein CR513_19506, partial [Mucuna pruriens]